MADSRIALDNGSVLALTDERMIGIVSEIGRGANCVVYNAVYHDSIGVKHYIRLKECYPAYMMIERKKDNSLELCGDGEVEFERAKQEFVEAYRKNVFVKQTLGLVNSTVNPAEIINANNTVYILMTLDEGCDYGKYKDQTLEECITHIKSLAKVIQKYHTAGYLHLDIKPENMFILPESSEHILLFDFDSVARADEISSGEKAGLSFSKGFSAPEQIKGEIKKIGFHTDIFSIGAVLFFKLFNRKAELDDCRISSTYDYDNMCYKSEKYQPKLYRELSVFFKKTISTSTIPRWQTVEPVIEKLDELISLSNPDGVYLKDSFLYNSGCFVGRKTEIMIIDDILSANQLVFLSGIGGIGKTELAKKYADKYREKYNTITFAIYEKDIKTLVNNEIMINNLEQDEKETDEEYFKRKLKILEKTAKEDDLIIIDNFDVEYDEKLESLFRCPAKFIITTRMDFRDYNYKQINVDKMADIEELLELFYSYNDEEYSETDEKYIEKLIEYTDRHTMTVELIAKYLRTTLEKPEKLYNKFLEKEGTSNTGQSGIKQRKDRKLRIESVNNHISTLFDISGLNNDEKEIMSSLSLFAGIRILQEEYEKIYGTDTADLYLRKLIKSGWIEYNEKNKKISLHQVIQDVVYKNLVPCAEKCPNIVAGMICYAAKKPENHSEKLIRRKILKIFMERLSGENISYARLCLAYGKDMQLDKALEICKKNESSEAYDIIQKIYRKKINNALVNGMAGSSDKNTVLNRLKEIKNMMEQVIRYCGKYRETVLNTDELLSYKKDDSYANAHETINSDINKYIAKEYIAAASEIQKGLEQNMYAFLIDKPDKDNARICELDEIYDTIEWMYREAVEAIPKTAYEISQKEELYKKIFDFYSEGDFMVVYRNKYYADMDKAYKYQKILSELRKNETVDTSDMSITDENGTTKLWFDDISCTEYAGKLEEEGKYTEAEVYYKKAYENGEEMYETAMKNIAAMYEKTGEYEKAAQEYKSVLDKDKKRMSKETDCLIGYSCDICLKLVKLYIKQDRYSEAEKYIKELISYEKKDAEEYDEYALNYMIAAFYTLYKIEQKIDGEHKKNIDIPKQQTIIKTGNADVNAAERLWKECLIYYDMLGENKIESEIFDFIYEYVRKENAAYENLVKIADRIENWQNEEFKEKLINSMIAKYKKEKLFAKHHIVLLIKLSETLIEYDDNDTNIRSAMNCLDNAKKICRQNKITDEYILGILIMAEIKIRTVIDIDIESSDYDKNYAKINELRKRCDYMAVAKYRIKYEENKTEEQIQIWEEAADGYDMAEKYISEQKCLKQLYKIMNEMCEKGEIKKTDAKYMNLLEKMINVHIAQMVQEENDIKKIKMNTFNDTQTSENKISEKSISSDEYKMYAEKYYDIALKSYEAEDKTKAWKKINEIKKAGDLFRNLRETKKAMEIYINAIYLAFENEKEAKNSKIKGRITDIIITLKNELSGCITNCRAGKKEVSDANKNEHERQENIERVEEESRELIKKITDEYEYKKIEFKNNR